LLGPRIGGDESRGRDSVLLGATSYLDNDGDTLVGRPRKRWCTGDTLRDRSQRCTCGHCSSWRTA